MLTLSHVRTPKPDRSSTLPAVIIPSSPVTSSPSNATSMTALNKGTTRTDSGPAAASGSLPNSFLTIQIGAKRNELAMTTETTTIPTTCPQIRHAETFLKVPQLDCTSVAP